MGCGLIASIVERSRQGRARAGARAKVVFLIEDRLEQQVEETREMVFVVVCGSCKEEEKSLAFG
jgi:hypothetical protein